jgi:hypothetical protein
VRYDHVTDDRFRHGTKFSRWRPDKAPRQCTMQIKRATKPGALGARTISGLIIGNMISGNALFGIRGSGGFGNNFLATNNAGHAQVDRDLIPLQPNACSPSCF